MRNRLTRSLAMLLVCLQLAALLCFAAPAAQAAPAAETPVRNPVIEGTTRFGSFGFTGDLQHQRDGIDYVTTYYYTDDTFSPSAVNPNATRKVMNWRDLEDLSAATLSKAFALAICSTSEDNVPVDWTHKSRNGERFFAECGFDNVFVSQDFNAPTGRDTLGYMIASKPVTVWDARTQTNRAFTLVAIGVRGGGYGAEWASNFTIGDSYGAAGNDKSVSGTYRHKGFQDGADMVRADLDAYLKEHHVTGDVKYWVTGYSRSGAVANLVAGDITDRAAQYGTTRDDVYCYTYEAAAGALAADDPDGSKYPNIHNILNAMDLVPRMSPPEFGHGRLGVDYRLPYYGNTADTAEITTYFTRMRTVLPHVAALPDLYNRNVTGYEDDPVQDAVITDSDPAVYPYDRPIQIKSFKLLNILSGGLTQPVSNAESVIAPDEGLMFDQFLDQFVHKFVCSRAWDAAYARRSGLGWSDADMTYDPLSHEFQFVRVYQHGIRSLGGLIFKTPGKGFKSFGGVMDHITDAIDLQALWDASGIAAHYGLLHLDANYATHVQEMIDPAVSLVNKIADVSGIFDEEDLNEAHAAVRELMPALLWLYCEDHVKNNGEYLGTLMDNFSTIFVNHIPEMEVSWLMSLDEVFTCDYRELTLPKATRVTVRDFRAQYGETLASGGTAPIIAVLEDGVNRWCIDDRVTVTAGQGTDDRGQPVETMTIRYPACLDLRFDVTPLGEGFDDLYLAADSYTPRECVNVRSVCTRDAQGHITADAVDHDSLLVSAPCPGADALTAYAANHKLPLRAFDTLQICAPHASNLPGAETPAEYSVRQPADLFIWHGFIDVVRSLFGRLFDGVQAW